VTTLDHKRLTERCPVELRKFRRLLLGLQGGSVEAVAVRHENDSSCCQREDWSTTEAEIVWALRPDTAILSVDLYACTPFERGQDQ
jgi:hypothetical protein